jgi:hypothetical protein
VQNTSTAQFESVIIHGNQESNLYIPTYLGTYAHQDFVATHFSGRMRP